VPGDRRDTTPSIRSNEVKSTSTRRLLTAVAALALGLSVTACGAANEGSGGDGGSGGDAVTLDAGGATSQAKAEGVWRANYQDESGNTVNYEEVGSGTGRENFNSGAYVLAGSDSYLNDDEGELSAAKERCGSDPIEVPAYVSPIAVAFNVEGVDSLNLSAETVANIFNGTITTWNDDAIAADNPDADLPDTAIAVIHRSDDSGTTTNFTDYLYKASNGAWTTEADGLWPEDGIGQGLEGTSGVIGGITDTDGGIGYADDSAVRDTDLGVVSIGVGSSFNPPSAEGAAMVVANSPRAEGRPDVDMAIDIDRTITDEGAYPLLLTSYLIACQSYDDEATATAVKDYLSYVLSADGQQAAADDAGSAPLDSSLQEEAAGIVEQIAAS
jgi:phosphate transport system substrate-binding protein